MSSPSFRLLRLPLVAQRHIIDFWTPYEIYQLSVVSKKSKIVARLSAKQKPKLSILLEQNLGVKLDFSIGTWRFECRYGPQRPRQEFEYYCSDSEEDEAINGNYRITQRDDRLNIFSIYTFHLISDFLKMMEQIFDVFGCVMDHVEIGDSVSDVRLIRVISWMNNCPRIVGVTSVNASTDKRNIFDKHFEKSVTVLLL